MDIYENIVVGNYLFGLGASIGMRHTERITPPTVINLLQQTPQDRPLGDVLLENCKAIRLVEFKRKANDSIKEKTRLIALRAMLRDDAHRRLVPVSRSIHWYVETQQVYGEFRSRILPYLDFDNQQARSVGFEEFIIEAALRNQASSEAATAELNAVRMALGNIETRIPEKVSAKVVVALDAKVQEVSKRAFAEFDDAKAAAYDAVKAFKDAAASAAWRIGWRITVGGCFLVIITAVCAWYLMPSSSELKAKRAELAQLQDRIAKLKAAGADTLATCGPKARACARINLKELAIPYGQEGDYRILSGH